MIYSLNFKYFITILLVFIFSGCFGLRMPDFPTPAQNTTESPKEQPIENNDKNQYEQSEQTITDNIDVLKSKCDKSDLDSCVDLANMYEKLGENSLAFKLNSKSCQSGSESACSNLGLMYEKGIGTNASPKQAIFIWKESCNRGGADSCYFLANSYRKGEYVTRDYELAMQAYKNACNGQNLRACANIGAMYENGLGVEKDELKAYKIYKVACFRGLDSVCEYMKKMGERLNIK